MIHERQLRKDRQAKEREVLGDFIWSYKQGSKTCRKSSKEDPSTTVPRVFVVWSCVLAVCHVNRLLQREKGVLVWQSPPPPPKYSLQKPLCAMQNGRIRATALIVMESFVDSFLSWAVFQFFRLLRLDYVYSSRTANQH
jgi:hypothetical protein